jgi:hypothetical protein
LLLAHDLGYFASDIHKELTGRVSEVKRMLTGFIQHLNEGAAA